jgi:hypothetical protein
MHDMTDDEYRDYLAALARKHLRVSAIHRFGPASAMEHLHYDIERLSSVARFARAVSERAGSPELLKALGEELRHAYVDHLVHVMEESGVLPALDEAPDITFAEFRRSVIPEEDVYLLRRAGVEDPDAEITLLIQYVRRRLPGREGSPSDLVKHAEEELKRAAEGLIAMAQSSGNEAARSETKKRRLFNGIGKILGGAITGAGNLLLATGTVAAPNPATAYGVIGSSALAVGSICQGIGDLRGE